MAKKKIRRSEAAHLKKMRTLWIVSLFFLVLLVVLDIVVVYNQIHPPNRALTEEIDFSKIHFEGLALGQEAPAEVLEHSVIDAEFDYSWNNISISTDDNNIITRLGFYTTDPIGGENEEEGININNVSLDYRDYPLQTISEFAAYFGYTKVTNFGYYKYLTYRDDDYVLDLTIFDGNIYNVVLYKEDPNIQK